MKKTVRLRKRPKVVTSVPEELLPDVQALAGFWWDGKTDKVHEGFPPYESLKPYPGKVEYVTIGKVR